MINLLGYFFEGINFEEIAMILIARNSISVYCVLDFVVDQIKQFFETYTFNELFMCTF